MTILIRLAVIFYLIKSDAFKVIASFFVIVTIPLRLPIINRPFLLDCTSVHVVQMIQLPKTVYLLKHRVVYTFSNFIQALTTTINICFCLIVDASACCEARFSVFDSQTYLDFDGIDFATSSVVIDFPKIKYFFQCLAFLFALSTMTEYLVLTIMF